MVCCSVINNCYTRRDTDAEEVAGETDTWKQTDKEGMHEDTI